MALLAWIIIGASACVLSGYLLGRCHAMSEQERQFASVSAHMEAVLARADEQLGDGARPCQ